eukprot:SAG31_NODE_1140_length_9701_cov_43.848261_10_plen_268_part_00
MHDFNRNYHSQENEGHELYLHSGSPSFVTSCQYISQQLGNESNRRIALLLGKSNRVQPREPGRCACHCPSCQPWRVDPKAVKNIRVSDFIRLQWIATTTKRFTHEIGFRVANVPAISGAGVLPAAANAVALLINAPVTSASKFATAPYRHSKVLSLHEDRKTKKHTSTRLMASGRDVAAQDFSWMLRRRCARSGLAACLFRRRTRLDLFSDGRTRLTSALGSAGSVASSRSFDSVISIFATAVVVFSRSSSVGNELSATFMQATCCG